MSTEKDLRQFVEMIARMNRMGDMREEFYPYEPDTPSSTDVQALGNLIDRARQLTGIEPDPCPYGWVCDEEAAD